MWLLMHTTGRRLRAGPTLRGMRLACILCAWRLGKEGEGHVTDSPKVSATLAAVHMKMQA